jgi:hypothetical protein
MAQDGGDPSGRRRGIVSLCLAAGGATKALMLTAFTLAWNHSVEKVEWQEDWRVTPAGLQLVAARIKGSGAGMEPAPGARLHDGWYEWTIDRAAQSTLVLGQSGAAGEWRLCAQGQCRSLSETIGPVASSTAVTASACETKK